MKKSPIAALIILFFCLGTVSCKNYMSKDVKFGVKEEDTDNGGTPTDSDADGLSSEVEESLKLDPLEYDNDADGFSDGLEYVSSSGDPLDNSKQPEPLNKSVILDESQVKDDSVDTDTDGLGNLYEQSVGLKADSEDSDSDGYSDMLEVFAGSDGTKAESKPTRTSAPVDDGVDNGASADDTDKDGLSDAVEQLNGTKADKSDSDNDGFSDALEYVMGSDGASELSIPDFSE